MKIAILNLTGGGMSGGYEKYLRNILPLIAAHPKVEAVFCASPNGLGRFDNQGLCGGISFFDCKPFRFVRTGRDLGLKAELVKFSPDVIFIPMERYFKFLDIPVVNMVRNMLPLVPFSNTTLREKLKNRFRRKVAKSAIMNSSRVIAVSGYVKDHLVNKWGVPAKRIGLAYHGVTPPGNEEGVKPKGFPLDWKKDFLFTAGSVDPYRGLEDIFLSMKSLLDYGSNIKLVIAGELRRGMAAYKKKLEVLERKCALFNKIFWAGKLNSQEMLWCYKNCRIFIAASKVEACPNIVLESLACGCIAIAADNPPLPEFFDKSAFYYEPGNAQALAKRICEAINCNGQRRADLSGMARARAQDFSWHITAEKTVRELEKALSMRNNDSDIE